MPPQKKKYGKKMNGMQIAGIFMICGMGALTDCMKPIDKLR